MKNIAVTLSGGKALTLNLGDDFSSLEKCFPPELRPIAAVRVNNELVPLSARAAVNSCKSLCVEAVPLSSAAGALIHRHTLSFLLCAAARKVCPQKKLRVGHSLGNAYYFSFDNGEKPEAVLLDALKNAIDEFISSAATIEKSIVPFNEALAYFENECRAETALLLRQTGAPQVALNSMTAGQDGTAYSALFTEVLLPNAGLVRSYELSPYNGGFLLRFPIFINNGHAPSFYMPPFSDLPGIFEVFQISKQWGRMAGVETAAHLNKLVAERAIKEFIWIAEANADKRLARIADAISSRDKVKIVLIAGPSSSGKTTTAKRLSIQLKTVGLLPVQVSLDDYYLHSDFVPRNEKGEPDFECLGSLDVPFLNTQLCELLDGREVTLPSFDFKTGLRREGKKISLKDGMVLVLEGIHGLNDALTPGVPRDEKFKLYASALTQINIDAHNRIATTDNRILRRLVRDNQFRGISAERTLKMWPDVQRGAEKHIFTFQNEADAVFNTALDYEIPVLKLYAEPLLRSVHPDSADFSEAARLLSLLANFLPVSPEMTPQLSTLREFIGGSAFKY